MEDILINKKFNCDSYVNFSKSDIFSVLQNDRRRRVLEILNTDGSKSLRSISEDIACMESGTPEPASNVRKSIYVSLLQTHLPKMEKMGIVRYDREDDRVELTPKADNFNVYLETVEKGDIPWSHYYVGLSTVSLMGGALLFTGIVELVSTMQWMFFVDMLFLISSLGHLAHMKKIII